MKKLQIIASTIMIAFLTTGCATIFGGGSDERLSVESSEPLRVKVVGTDGQVINKTTPFTINIERDQNYTVKVVSDKYESEDVYLGKKIRTLAIFNLLFLLGWAIDFATGNVWEHKMHYVFIDTKELELKKAMGLDSFNALISFVITGMEEDKDFTKTKISKEIKFRKI